MCIRDRAVAAAAVMAVGVGSAHAVPPVQGAPTAMSVVSADGAHIVTTLTDATFVPAPVSDALSIVDRHGKIVETVSLAVPLNDQSVPLRAAVSADGSTATLTPVLSESARTEIAAGVRPVSAKKDRAFEQMIWHITNGWNRGGNVATAVGALAGLIVGCIVIVGCVWGAGVGAAIGAVVGINNGDPRAGQAILNWINTP